MEKKDLNQVLSEEQLGNVQGGLDEKVVTNCMFPGCSWNYTGPIDKAAIAQQSHTKATGHNQFA